MKPTPVLETIGATDYVDFPELGWYYASARIDSGATSSSIHCSSVKLIQEGEITLLRVKLDAKRGAPEHVFTTSNFKETVVKNSSGLAEKRYVIKTVIELFGKKIKTEFSLANRKKMRFPILLGRKLLKNRFLIDVSQKDLSVKRKLQHHAANPLTGQQTESLPHSLK
ncbi:ATP-dependent zinc protease family protein [Dyadobacter tibetensis]|uniref:ATP-dependent zinc protease family protein n=1 Tax=Dyadobacter tibetensis TaxID=1211851 RepID=UPI00047122C0|nr:RimK/LysX family protein [Dyadobacter tibetensis]